MDSIDKKPLGEQSKMPSRLLLRLSYAIRLGGALPIRGRASKELAEKIAGFISGKEKPLPEPDAWLNKTQHLFSTDFYEAQDWVTEGDHVVGYFEKPPARKPLTDDEILDIGYAAGFHMDTIEDDETGEGSYGFINSEGDVDNEPFFKFARLVEKHCIKEQK